MNTSNNFEASFNLDDLLKRVESIVDEQIDELSKGKNRSSQNLLMKEDFARGNPYSPNARQVDDKSSAVFSKLRSEENQKVVSNLADRLKENICRAIDEYSEGLYNQLQDKPCKCEEKGCNHPAGDEAGQDETKVLAENMPEAAAPQVEDVTEVLTSPPEPEINTQPEESALAAPTPQVEDVTETPAPAPLTPEEAPTEEVLTAETVPEEAPTEEVLTAETVPEEAPQQGSLFNSSFSFGQSAVEQPAAPETNDISGDAPVPTPPTEDISPPEASKAAAVVSKTASDMEQINKQRLDQYFAKKVKFSL